MSFNRSISDLVSVSDDPLLFKAPWWERIEQGKVAKILNGAPWRSSYFNKKEGVPLIRIRDVTTGQTETLYNGPIDDAYWVDDGDLLVGMDGDFNCRLWSGGRGLLNQRVCKISPDERFYNKKFLAYVLPGYLSAINKETHSITVKHLSSKTLAETPLPLPSLNEQKRIVEKLEILFDRLSLTGENLKNISTLIKLYKHSILASAFSGKLTERWRENQHLDNAAILIKATAAPIQGRGGRQATDRIIDGRYALAVNKPSRKPPAGWSWVPLLKIARQETGHTPSRNNRAYWDGGIPWIGIKDARDHHGGVIADTIQTISKSGLENSSARLLPPGTVCLSRTASVGYVTIMGKSMATSQDFATWTCSSAITPKYLMYALMAEGDGIRAFGKGTTHTTIYFPEIRALNICLAPLEEQHEIVRIIEKAFSQIEHLVSKYDSVLKLMAQLQRAIMMKAFSGEIAPRDPNDEPSSVLLERIRSINSQRKDSGRRDSDADILAQISSVAVKGSPAKIKAKRKDRMSGVNQAGKASAIKAIMALKKKNFSFDDLQREIPTDYESLKDAVFSLLEDPKSGLKQVYDKNKKQMRFLKRA